MSRKVLEQFQISHQDPSRPSVLPSNIAVRLAQRPDYKNGSVQRATDDQIAEYNAILAHDGKQAADRWLDTLWL